MRTVARSLQPRFALIYQRAGLPGSPYEEVVFASEREAREWVRQEGVVPVRLEHLQPIGRPGRQRTFLRARYPF
jgi:hypothetical protein